MSELNMVKCCRDGESIIAEETMRLREKEVEMKEGKV